MYFKFGYIFRILCIILPLGGAFWFYKNIYFPEYQNISIQTNNSKTVPSEKFIKIISVGNSLSYADSMWIGLVQYIGKNPFSTHNSSYPFKIIDTITSISPKFGTAYEWALWLMPIPQHSNPTYDEEQKKQLQFPLKIAKKGIQELCNSQKIAKIKEFELSPQLWKQDDLKNPCQNGMLPYMIAFYDGQLMQNQKIEKEFYKIAGMQGNAPKASQILAILSTAPKDNPRKIALNFALMALGGHDTEPFGCLQLTQKVLQLLEKNTISPQEIIILQQEQKKIPTLNKHQDVGIYTCDSMLDRSLKYVFLDFINQESKKYPNIDTIDELLKKIPLKNIPLTKTQENMSLYKNGNIWEYYQPAN